MNILAVIPARGGSKGIPGKNIAILAGKPLIAYTIEAARAATCLSRIVVSTDDAAIAEVSRRLGAEVILRPAELAGDTVPTLPVLQHVVAAAEAEGFQAEAVMTLQPTSPLRRACHIDEAAKLFMSDPRADSLVSCIEVPHIFHPLSVMRMTSDGYLESWAAGAAPTRRQEKEPVFARNGAAIYITRRECLAEYVFGGRLIPYFMSPAESLDIDRPEDLLEAERLLRERA